MQNTAKQS